MPYNALDPADIVAGEPTKEEIFTTIRDNQEYFDASIDSLQGNSTFDIIDVHMSGNMNTITLASLNSRMPIYKAPAAGDFISAVMTLLEVSTSGTIEMDIELSTDNGVTWTSQLTTEITLTTTTVGSVSGIPSWVTNPSPFNQNDLIRIQFTAIQVDQGSFHVSIYGER